MTSKINAGMANARKPADTWDNSAEHINRINSVYNQGRPNHPVKIDASVAVPLRPLRVLPSRLSAKAIIESLVALGVVVPSTLQASAQTLRQEELRETGWRVDLATVDKALSRADLTFAERLRFKYAIEMTGFFV